METLPTWLKLIAVTSVLAELTAAALVLWRPRARVAPVRSRATG